MATISINIVESSSKGNCIILNDGNSFLILDFGSSISNIKNSFLKLGINSKSIVNCLITHAHIDHIKSINENTICKISFYMSSNTKNIINGQFKKFISINKINKSISISNTNWKFKAYPTLHNIEGSLAFVIKNKNKKIIYLTDTNYFENKIFKNGTCYLVESNYGSEFINDKKREEIHNNSFTRNHLNLAESEKFIKKYITRKTRLCVFTHLSTSLKKTDLINNVCKNLSNKYKHCKFEFIDNDAINKICFEI